MKSFAERLNKRFSKISLIREAKSDNEKTVKNAIMTYEKCMDLLKSNPSHMFNDKPSKFYNMKTSEDKAKKAFEVLFNLEKALEKAIGTIVNEDADNLVDQAVLELEDALDEVSSVF